MIKSKVIILLVLFLSFSVNSNSQDKITIALSKGSGGLSYENYSEWLKNHNDNIEIIDLIQSENPLEDIRKADGLLLTGGPDVHPGRFEKEDEADRCSIDLERDTLEFDVLDYALDSKMPILGICRGHQVINVAMGGSLYTDIPSDLPDHSEHQIENGDARHEVKVDKGSYLYKISGVVIQEVNSNHHQGVEELGENLKSVAESPDGLNEAFEWTDSANKSWMLGVGWHPERLEKDDKLSKPIAKEFINAAKRYKKERTDK